MTYYCVAKLKGGKTGMLLVNAAEWRCFIENNFTCSKEGAEDLLNLMRREFPKCVYELVEVED